jgi:hypothetical protein
MAGQAADALKGRPTGGREPKVWSIQWKPLWSPTEKEIAETGKLVAEADKIYFEMGAVSSDDVVKSRYGGDTYSMETTVDFKAREAQKKIDEEKAAELDAASLAAMGQSPTAASGAPGDQPAKPGEPAPRQG